MGERGKLERSEALELYGVYRDYIKHEDTNINNRMTWFIQLNSFLIASAAVVIGASIQVVKDLVITDVRTPLILMFASIVQIGISTTGYYTARLSAQFITAGAHAVAEIQKLGNENLQSWIDDRTLPGLTNGKKTVRAVGDPGNPAIVLRRVPKFMESVWAGVLCVHVLLLVFMFFLMEKRV